MYGKTFYGHFIALLWHFCKRWSDCTFGSSPIWVYTLFAYGFIAALISKTSFLFKYTIVNP